MKAVGIDLGTTYSLVATVNNAGEAVIVKNSDGTASTPSVVYFPVGAAPIVGREAKERQEAGAEPVASFFKTSMGKAGAGMDVHGKWMTPTDFSEILLKKLATVAEEALGEPVHEVVVTVPAYFEDAERTATLKAAERAGLRVLRLLHEPTAAALSLGLDTLRQHGRVFLVYDLGGGTFDASVVELEGDELKVRATKGAHELGGRDWDARLLEQVRRDFEDEHGYDPAGDVESEGVLKVACETAKKALSSATEVEVEFRTKSEGATGVMVTRAAFETLTDDLLSTTKATVDRCLRDYAEKCLKNGWRRDATKRLPKDLAMAGSRELWGLVDQVLLVGGSTRMPMVTNYIVAATGRAPLRVMNPDEAVALGAALAAAGELKKRGVAGRLAVAPAASPVMRLPVLRDITAHTMGMIAESKDRMKYLNSKILPKNSPIPNTERKVHVLLTDGSKPLEVFVTQGESDEWWGCTVVKKYEFSGIAAPTGGGEVEIEVSYTYDENGVVQAAAKQLRPERVLTGREYPAPGEKELERFHRSPKENDPPPPKKRAGGAFVLAIDTSGSMDGSRINTAKAAAIRNYVDKLPPEYRVGVVEYNNSARLVCDCTCDRKKVRAALSGLRACGGTSGNPFDPAERMLSMEAGAKYVVVLADGGWDWDVQHAIKAGADRLKRQGVTVWVVAIETSGYARDFLLSLASSAENAIATTERGMEQAMASTIARVQ